MSILGKLVTAARLATQGDWTVFRRQFRHNSRKIRLHLRGRGSFVHRDLGFPSVCHPNWPDSADQFLNLLSDTWEIELVRRWLRADDLAIDAGANLGLYAFAAAAAMQGGRGRILAIDADPFVVQNLDTAARLLATPSLIAVHAAIADHNGEATFYVRSDHSITAEQSLRPRSGQLDSSVRIVVPMRTLGAICDQQAGGQLRPDMVKLDLEGAEAAALAAAPTAWFAADGPLWIVEINPGALRSFETSPADVMRHFTPVAFDCWVLPKHPLQPGGAQQLRLLTENEPFDDSLYYNLVAIPRADDRTERRASISGLLPLCAKAVRSPA